jgi:hypothetical protein
MLFQHESAFGEQRGEQSRIGAANVAPERISAHRALGTLTSCHRTIDPDHCHLGLDDQT